MDAGGLHELLSADPDSVAQCKLVLAYAANFPLALGRIECAFGLPINISVGHADLTGPIHFLELIFTGKVMYLSELQMKLAAWESQYPQLQPIPQEALYGDLGPETPGPSPGASES